MPNLLKKNKNLHLIENLLEFSHFKTQYIKDVIGLLEGLLILEKIINFYQKETDWIVETEIPIVQAKIR